MQRVINGIKTEVFKSTKQGSGTRRGGLIVLQEWWGITNELRRQGTHFAENSGDCMVLTVDLYEGKMTLDAAEAEHMMSNLDFPKAIEKVQEVGRYLKENEGVSKLGIVGFCMGGALSAAASVKCTKADGSPLFDAGSVFYGVPPMALADTSTVKIPQQGHFGMLDNMEGFSDPSACDSLEANWKKAGIVYEMHRYPTVGHAFMNELPDSVERKRALGQIDADNGAKHDPEAIKTAWARTFAFFGKHGVLG